MTNEHPKPLAEALEAQLMEAAFARLLTEEADELENAPLAPGEDELLRQAERSRPVHLQLIARGGTHRSLRKTLLQIGRIAAILLLVMLLSVGTAMAVNRDFRTKVLDCISNITNEYVRVGIGTTGKRTAVPAGWTASFFLMNVPLGYTMTNYSSSLDASQVRYENDLGHRILFRVLRGTNATHLNARAASSEAVYLNFGEALMITTPLSCTITWISDDDLLSVTANDVGTAAQAADMVERVHVGR